jgi:hypothetical protein
MSFYIDSKYLMMISHRLPLFAKKKADLYQCRCVICGDSKTDKKKSRGYFYRQRNDLFYKCHNCDASKHFGSFLQDFDPTLYSQYVFERYTSGEGAKKAHTKIEKAIDIPFNQPVFRKKKKSPLDDVAVKLLSLPEEHPARVYCTNRKLPVDKLGGLYYLDRTRDITNIFPQYRDTIRSDEPRICFPFFHDGEFMGATLRAIGPSNLRYIMVKNDDEHPAIFGYDTVDFTKPFYVVEGQIDSLFLDNAMACNGTSFGKLEHLDIPKENCVVVVDNQPRNTEVADITKKYVELGYSVCIWPETLKEKDINDMVLAGVNVPELIDQNTFMGLRAKLQYSTWRKVK